MASVSLSSVHKRFGSVEVLHDVSLEIPDGAFVVLVGPSGCGKSTLLRIIAGLEHADAGDVRIGDQRVNDTRPRDRDVAMVFQNYALYPHLTVAGNMGFSLALRRERPDVIARKVRETATLLGLEPYLERLPRQLSGGQRQRVAMGRAIVRAPRVFLFDEPLSNLDAQLRVQMRAEIKDLHQRLGTTTVYVTHDQMEAMTLADTIVVLRSGVVEQTGSPLDVYDRPANLFVATFIGSPAMNILAGVVDDLDGAPICRMADGTTMPIPPFPRALAGRRIYVGIRPEQIGRGPDGVPAEVDVVEQTGAETHVFLRCGGQRVVAVFRERFPVRAGELLRLTIPREAVHVFDRDGEGRRLN
jgi:multiple sugar transport system ATP-binding protein